MEWGHWPPQIFGSSVNPILTGGGQIMPTNYHWPPKVFHLPASLVTISTIFLPLPLKDVDVIYGGPHSQKLVYNRKYLLIRLR